MIQSNVQPRPAYSNPTTTIAYGTTVDFRELKLLLVNGKKIPARTKDDPTSTVIVPSVLRERGTIRFVLALLWERRAPRFFIP